MRIALFVNVTRLLPVQQSQQSQQSSHYFKIQTRFEITRQLSSKPIKSIDKQNKKKKKNVLHTIVVTLLVIVKGEREKKLTR